MTEIEIKDLTYLRSAFLGQSKLTPQTIIYLNPALISIVCLRLSWQGGFYKGFTGAVAHEALPPYRT